jgi:hypothetical protein
VAKCTTCGKPTEFMMSLCPECIGLARQEAEEREAQHRVTPDEEQKVPRGDRRVSFATLGFLAGAVVGFLSRPSVFLVGQLPFAAVISRGGTLRGMDELLVPAAQQSFNHTFLFALVGAHWASVLRSPCRG